MPLKILCSKCLKSRWFKLLEDKQGILTIFSTVVQLTLWFKRKMSFLQSLNTILFCISSNWRQIMFMKSLCSEWILHWLKQSMGLLITGFLFSFLYFLLFILHHLSNSDEICHFCLEAVLHSTLLLVEVGAE